MSAPEYARLITRQARLERFRKLDAPEVIIVWAERLVIESEALASAERIILAAEAGRGLTDR